MCQMSEALDHSTLGLHALDAYTAAHPSFAMQRIRRCLDHNPHHSFQQPEEPSILT